MKIPAIVRRRFQYALALAIVVQLAACHSSDKDEASKMTSFSAQSSKSATPQLFTIPTDQMSHVQVVTIEPTTMKRSLRLTGAVAYNAFNTTPCFSSRSLNPAAKSFSTSRSRREWGRLS